MVSSCSLFIKLSSGDKEFDSCSMVDQVTFVCVCVCVCVRSIVSNSVQPHGL